MKKNCALLACIWVLFTIKTSAQLSLGLRGGVFFGNVYTTEFLDGITPDFNYLTEYSIAGLAEYQIGKHFAIQPELAFTRKGFALREDIDVNLFNIPIPVGAKALSKFDYLELPLLAKAKFGGKQVNAYVLAGPTFGYALDGKLVARADGLLDFKILETDIDPESINYERFEVGGTIGAGVTLETGIGQFFADARYNHGFTQLYNIPLVDEKVRNKGFGINVGFAVPVGR